MVKSNFIIIDRIDPNLFNIIRGYVKNFLRTNYWRVENILEWEDAEQEAMFLLVIMEKRLIKNGKDATIVTPQQYMAFFKMAFINHFNTLSKRDTRYKCVITESSFNNDDEDDFLISDCIEDTNVGFLECVADQAPSEVKAVLNLILNAPKELLEAVSMALNKDLMDNSVLCRLLDYDPKEVNVVELTKTYFNNL